MITEPFSAWWCCQNPRERLTVQALHFSWLTNPLYITKAAYEAIAASTGESASITMDAYFRSHFGLVPGTITDGDGNEIPVYYFDLVTWLQVAAFAASDGLACSAKCKLLTFQL